MADEDDSVPVGLLSDENEDVHMILKPKKLDWHDNVDVPPDIELFNLKNVAGMYKIVNCHYENVITAAEVKKYVLELSNYMDKLAMAEMGGPEDEAPPPKGGPQAAAAEKKPDAKTQDSQKEMQVKAGDTAPKGAAARASALKNTPNKKAQKK